MIPSPFERAILGLARQGIKYDLHRMRALSERCGQPHRRYATLHVAGSNGKGSTSALLAAILQAAGYRVGLYTSPHLVSFRERIRVDGLSAEEPALAKLYEELRPVLADVGASFFEVMTLLAFVHFARVEVDAAVIEVGLGGRLDATNVIEPAGVAITSLALEHTQILGSTIEEIAREKGGIIKRAPVVTSARQPAAREVLRRLAAERGAELRVIEEGRDWRAEGEELVWLESGERFRVSLAGAHQMENAAVALALAMRLDTLGTLSLPPEARASGIAQAIWPARFDVRAHAGREIVFDVAHNPAGAEALADLLRATYPGVRLPIVVGMLADKDHGPVLDALAPLADAVWATTPDYPERALPASALAALWQARGVPAEAVATPEAAVQMALSSRTTGPLVVTGSLFTVGPAMAALGFSPVEEPVGLGPARRVAGRTE